MSQLLSLAQRIQSLHWISKLAGGSALEAYFVRLGGNASQAWVLEMELRHLRYFVAVAETESLSLAAKSKLHTSQPSLSRQLRDLEEEIGAQLMTRTARGVALTPAGRAFLDHAPGLIALLEAAKGCHKVLDLAARRGFAGFKVALNAQSGEEGQHHLGNRGGSHPGLFGLDVHGEEVLQ